MSTRYFPRLDRDADDLGVAKGLMRQTVADLAGRTEAAVASVAETFRAQDAPSPVLQVLPRAFLRRAARLARGIA